MTKEGPMITIGMVSYNRPLFLKEAVTSLFKKPGRDDFEFILWENSNDKETLDLAQELSKKYKFRLYISNKNIGSDANAELLDFAKGKYYVLLEEDMIWFQDNWLDNLVKGLEQPNNITKAGEDLGFRKEWGIMATNVLIDPVNNAGMWPERLKPMIEHESNGIVYWVNMRAGGGALIFRTEDLRRLKAFPVSSTTLNGAMAYTNAAYESDRYLNGHIRDTYIYHACSPFWNQLYKDVWKLKQKGQTIEEAFKQYSEKGNFDWDNDWILKMFLEGNFNKYAEELCKIHLNNRS